MADGITPYPRWDGDLSHRSRLGTVARNELLLVYRRTWSLFIVGLGFAWGLASIIEFYQLASSSTTHTWTGYLAMQDQLLWFALAAAAAIGGPTLLEDQRSGALELYRSRALTTWEYLGGKVAALLLITVSVILVPALVYWGTSYVVYDGHPDGWAWAPLGSLAYALMWGLMVSGLALGLSAVSRSKSGATLLLLGGFVVLAFVVSPPGIFAGMAPLPELTANEDWTVLSPFAAYEQQVTWLFGVDAPHTFPYWWGLVYTGALAVVGWALLWVRHPRVRGEEANDL